MVPGKGRAGANPRGTGSGRPPARRGPGSPGSGRPQHPPYANGVTVMIAKRFLPPRPGGRRTPPGRKSRPAVEAIESRLVLYSATGNAWPVPQLVTISFMPDGTNVNGHS